MSDLERKYLLHQLLPLARDVGVNQELRGWSWFQPPLKPYHEGVRLPMYAVASKYCPIGRDVYLHNVEGVPPKPSINVALGKMFHGVVSDCLLSFLQQRRFSFEEWWRKIRWDEIPEKPENVYEPSRIVWDFVSKLCEARIAEVSSRQPYASSYDVISSALPFLVEHKISGELLGLSGILSLDCYDYLHAIMFDLKVNDEPKDWHRLAPVGYSIVFESVYEVPVDICCIVYLNIRNGRISINKNLFFASEELRQWWIEERDKKLEIVAEGKDPGLPNRSQCREDCMYFEACYG
ncbi:MAG: type I-A CRISPR-associated protein Cas4/Csa1 [Candidatus Bathyarchaeota archaeon]|nr:type I-A CRISPR-associated protein Cas4/Csa1 [Candidatus Bathyarchaeota archaeon]